MFHFSFRRGVAGSSSLLFKGHGFSMDFPIALWHLGKGCCFKRDNHMCSPPWYSSELGSLLGSHLRTAALCSFKAQVPHKHVRTVFVYFPSPIAQIKYMRGLDSVQWKWNIVDFKDKTFTKSNCITLVLSWWMSKLILRKSLMLEILRGNEIVLKVLWRQRGPYICSRSHSPLWFYTI